MGIIKGYGSRLVRVRSLSKHSFCTEPGTVVHFLRLTLRSLLEGYEQDRHVNTISRFDSWILLKRWPSRVMASLH